MRDVLVEQQVHQRRNCGTGVDTIQSQGARSPGIGWLVQLVTPVNLFDQRRDRVGRRLAHPSQSHGKRAPNVARQRFVLYDRDQRRDQRRVTRFLRIDLAQALLPLLQRGSPVCSRLLRSKHAQEDQCQCRSLHGWSCRFGVVGGSLGSPTIIRTSRQS